MNVYVIISFMRGGLMIGIVLFRREVLSILCSMISGVGLGTGILLGSVGLMIGCLCLYVWIFGVALGCLGYWCPVTVVT